MAQVIISMDEYNEMLYKDERIAELEETVEQLCMKLEEGRPNISEVFLRMRNTIQKHMKEQGIKAEVVDGEVIFKNNKI